MRYVTFPEMIQGKKYTYPEKGGERERDRDREGSSSVLLKLQS